MGWGSDPAAQEDPKDRTKLLWLGIVGLCAAMLLVLWLGTDGDATQTRAHVKHILIQYNPSDSTDRARAFALINDIKRWLNEGQSFESIAEDYSNDPASSSRGGDLGWVEPAELVASVDHFVWEGEVNQISDVISSEFGYHLVLVTKRTVSKAMQYQRELERTVFGDEETGNDSGNEAPDPR